MVVGWEVVAVVGGADDARCSGKSSGRAARFGGSGKLAADRREGQRERGVRKERRERTGKEKRRRKREKGGGRGDNREEGEKRE